MASGAKEETAQLSSALQAMDIVLQHITKLDKAENLEELNQILPELLKSIGNYTRSDRAYLFDWSSPAHTAFAMTHEWCAEGVRPTIGEMQDVQIGRMPNWMPLFEKGESIVSTDWVRDGAQATSEFVLFDGQDIHALIVLPIFSYQKLNGYIGLDNPENSIAGLSLKLLTSVGGHIGSLKENLHMMQELEEKQEELQKNLERMEQTLEEVRLNSEIISTISKIYWIIYRMDLVEGLYEEVSAETEMHRLTGRRGKLADLLKEMQDNIISEKYVQRMQHFMDLATLQKRLQDAETVSEEYQTKLMEAAEEAKRANIAKTDFLRRMSHDIRTPINGIRGMLEVAEHYQDDPQKRAECRKKIWDSSTYLLNLVNSVLDMNKLESGQIHIEEEPFNLLDIVMDLDSVIGTQATEKGITSLTGEHKVTHYHLIGAPLYIRQILMNIGANAVKYTPPGGSIEISCVEKVLDEENCTFCFTVRDTGIGMSEEFQKHIFEAFAQEKEEMGGTGSGLGMAICKQLVDLLNGSITFRSRTGQGTTFQVELPCRIDPNPKNQKEKRKNTQINLTGKRVLLAEDNELNAEIATFFLEQAGMQVTVAQNGQEAVAMYGRSQLNEYDLILMDIMMPVMNGYEAAIQIRKMDRKDAAIVPIIAMSANAFPDDVAEAKRAGMNEHLAKPVDGKKMLEVIQKYIQRQKEHW